MCTFKQKTLLQLMLCLLLFTGIYATRALAQQEALSAYTITLNFRQTDDIMPLIRPFLHPQGTMTGEGYKILLQTSAKNYRDLLQFVAELDVSMRTLRISVTVDSELALRENQPGEVTNEAEVAGALNKQNVKQYNLETRDKTPLTQQLQVVEGKWAKISTGESVPVGERTRNPDGTITETVKYQAVQTGFRVLPRLQNDMVTLFIQPQLDKQNAEGGGRIDTGSAETTVSGKLNQWILIGGAAEVIVNQAGSRIYSTEQRSQSHNQIFVKVEIIP